MDSAVIVAFNVGYASDDFFNPLDVKVAKTISTYNNNFCNEYKVN